MELLKISGGTHRIFLYKGNFHVEILSENEDIRCLECCCTNVDEYEAKITFSESDKSVNDI